MAKVLIIDDDPSVCSLLSRLIRRAGHEACQARTLEEGLAIASTRPVGLVFLDVRLPDGNGIKSIPAIQDVDAAPEVVIITGAADPDGAELAIRSGAWDYLEKPFSSQNVLLLTRRALQYREERESNRTPVALKLTGIVGQSRSMNRAYDTLARAACSDVHVLLNGETGTGKELFARAVHDNSHRSRGPFVVVDCTALPETLAESALFGHEKGAFTGATASRAGMIQDADGGTLFLDEIGDLSPTLQKKLLRVLQERAFRPVGAQREISSAFRLVAATNRDLDAMAAAGTFREDLLYRLRSVVIQLPPLRERSEDIHLLAMHYMKVYCDRYGIGTKGFSPGFFDVITHYAWPGNVRELAHAMEHSVSMAADDPTLFRIHLPVHIRADMIRKELEHPVPETPNPGPGFRESGRIRPLREVLDDTERQYITELMTAINGDVQTACSLSGLSRSRLYARLKKHGIQHRR